jgi:hypothetical protein
MPPQNAHAAVCDHPSQTAMRRLSDMKRSATASHLFSRDTPWLTWWQELILNWVSSWDSIGCLTVVSAADPEEFADWDLPTDLDIKRMELEELLSAGDS